MSDVQQEAQPTKDVVTAQEKAPPIKLEWEDVTSRQHIKIKLQGKAAKDLTQDERKALQKILKEEQDESRIAAAIARLTDNADRWGRKRIAVVTRVVTDDVVRFSKEEKDLLSTASATATKQAQGVRAQAEAEMKRLQKKLHNDLAALVKDREDVVNDIRNNFRPQYASAENRLKQATSDVSAQVGTYTELLRELEFPELEKLLKGETITIRGKQLVPLKD